MSLVDSAKEIKPQQWVLIAGAGLGLGLLLRARNKNKVTATAPAATATPPVDTTGYSGTGQTGYYYQGNAPLVNPNAPSDLGTTPTPISTVPVAPVNPNDNVLPTADRQVVPIFSIPVGHPYNPPGNTSVTIVNDPTSPGGWRYA